jgi:hypothetical protein
MLDQLIPIAYTRFYDLQSDSDHAWEDAKMFHDEADEAEDPDRRRELNESAELLHDLSDQLEELSWQIAVKIIYPLTGIDLVGFTAEGEVEPEGAMYSEDVL